MKAHFTIIMVTFSAPTGFAEISVWFKTKRKIHKSDFLAYRSAPIFAEIAGANSRGNHQYQK